MMNTLQSWPEPIVRVQSLSESGIRTIPERYVKQPSERPSVRDTLKGSNQLKIPEIDLKNLYSPNASVRKATLDLISRACRDWGFFQVVNHGVSHELMARTREAWREFFHLPLEVKQQYANSPTTYEGYGSRLGTEKDVKLDWSDYFFLHYFPLSLRDQNRWPTLPPSCRELIAEYGEELKKLCEKLLRILSISLGLKQNYLQQAFGGDDETGACLRVNFYPKCPQPDLTLGLSPHSDPGGITLLLPDDNVSGIQVRRGNVWVTVKPNPNAFIVNIGDQVEVLSNGRYRSVEHRVVVNSVKERVSLAFFCNPRGEMLIKPADQLVHQEDHGHPLYTPMTFNQYRSLIRTKGPSGKSHVELLKSPR